jgi:hypothetical protein
MSAVSAATFTTTTKYSPSGVTVRTDVTGVDGTMISYVIYDKNDPAPSESNIKYIDQNTVSDGTTFFTVTDTVANLDGNKILLGSSGEAVTADDAEKVVNIDNASDLVVSYDGVVNATKGSVTFLVSQSTNVQTGINVVAIDKETNEEVYEFNDLMNMAVNDGSYAKYYAIELIDESQESNRIDFSKYDFVVTPVVNGTAMTKISDNYFIVASN